MRPKASRLSDVRWIAFDENSVEAVQAEREGHVIYFCAPEIAEVLCGGNRLQIEAFCKTHAGNMGPWLLMNSYLGAELEELGFKLFTVAAQTDETAALFEQHHATPGTFVFVSADGQVIHSGVLQRRAEIPTLLQLLRTRLPAAKKSTD
mgnify:CR=1 FL=1